MLCYIHIHEFNLGRLSGGGGVEKGVVYNLAPQPPAPPARPLRRPFPAAAP